MDLETLKEEIRSRADIVDIVGRVVKLQKTGAAHKGLCPFHQEKTPSFHVDTRKQSYYCFGCQSGGDVFNFVMDYEHLDFMGAMERLAQQTGVPFELDHRGGNTPKGPKRDRLYAMHEQTTAWYESLLHDAPEGKPARDYLKTRDLHPDILRSFRIGFSPDSFDALLERLRKADFSNQEIEASGLVGVREQPRNGERFYDRFRGRLMFPIRDELGRVIGFSARVLSAQQSKAKYVNSPKTPLFKKSRVLYGIDRARTPISTQRRALLCEGQLDVIRCHEAGLDHAVAAQGTAITEEHARILKRYADEVILLLDSDAAGVKAALRSAEALLQSGLILRAASLPHNEDPDSLVKRKGPKALHHVVNDAESFIAFQVKSLLASETEINETSRMRIIRAVVNTIGLAPEALHREELIQQAADCLGVRPDALRQDLHPQLPTPSSPRRPTPTPKPSPRPETPHDSLTPREDLLLEMLYRHPEFIPLARDFLQPDHLPSPNARDMLTALYQVQNPTEHGVNDALRDHPARASLHALGMRRRSQAPSEAMTPQQALEQAILLLREDALKRKQHELQTSSAHGDSEQRDSLETDIWQLTMVARKLRECRLAGDWNAATTILEIYA